MRAITTLILRLNQSSRVELGVDDFDPGAAQEINSLEDAGLITSTGLVKSVRCGQCDEGHMLPVEQLDEPIDEHSRYFYDCPTYGREWLPVERLQLWAATTSKLCSVISRSLSPSGDYQKVNDILYRLGVIPNGKVFRTVFLASVPRLRRDQAGLLSDDVKNRIREVVILTLSRNADSTLFPAAAACISLHDVLLLHADHLSLDIAKINAAIAPTATANTSSENMFRRDGEKWVVCFERSELRYFDDLDGMHYISYLLQNPEKNTHVLDLYKIAHPAPQMYLRDTAKQSTNRTELTGNPTVPTSPLTKHSDDRSEFIEYSRQIARLKAERSKSERQGSQFDVSEIDSKIRAINQFVSYHYARDGRLRSEADKFKAARQTVRNAINLALRRISKELPEAGNHLRTSILMGTYCTYTSIELVHWRT